MLPWRPRQRRPARNRRSVSLAPKTKHLMISEAVASRRTWTTWPSASIPPARCRRRGYKADRNVLLTACGTSLAPTFPKIIRQQDREIVEVPAPGQSSVRKSITSRQRCPVFLLRFRLRIERAATAETRSTSCLAAFRSASGNGAAFPSSTWRRANTESGERPGVCLPSRFVETLCVGRSRASTLVMNLVGD